MVQVGHRVAFSPVVRIGTPPPPSHTGECVPLPFLVPGGEKHSHAGEGVGGPNSNEGRDTVVLYVYMYSVRKGISVNIVLQDVLSSFLHYSCCPLKACSSVCSQLFKLFLELLTVNHCSDVTGDCILVVYLFISAPCGHVSLSDWESLPRYKLVSRRSLTCHIIAIGRVLRWHLWFCLPLNVMSAWCLHSSKVGSPNSANLSLVCR